MVETGGMEIRHHTAGLVPGPGFYEMTAALYHSDPAPEPSLSSSIANMLISETPLHGWTCHPRLNPEHEADDGNAAISKGSVAHELILGKGAGIEVLDFEDYRKKAAQEARDNAIAAGLTPILAASYLEAETIAGAVFQALKETPDCHDFQYPGSRSELVMIWQDEGVWCRAMIDRLTPRGIVYDVKTSGRGLDDRTLQNKFEDGFDTQPGLYLRGLEALWPEMAGRFRWRWIFAEQTAPFAVRIEEAGAFALKEGAEKAEYALQIWRNCMSTGIWPGYPRRIGRLDPPEWSYNRWTERMHASAERNAPALTTPEQRELLYGVEA